MEKGDKESKAGGGSGDEGPRYAFCCYCNSPPNRSDSLLLARSLNGPSSKLLNQLFCKAVGQGNGGTCSIHINRHTRGRCIVRHGKCEYGSNKSKHYYHLLQTQPPFGVAVEPANEHSSQQAYKYWPVSKVTNRWSCSAILSVATETSRVTVAHGVTLIMFGLHVLAISITTTMNKNRNNTLAQQH